jgi:hypothetical protein
VVRVIRSLAGAVMALVAALTIGLASSVSAPAPASATTVTDAHPQPPSPLTVITTPFMVGVHVIESIAEGIADAVEMIATPAPISIPAPRSGT